MVCFLIVSVVVNVGLVIALLCSRLNALKWERNAKFWRMACYRIAAGSKERMESAIKWARSDIQ